jgi:hypothetical protein
MPKAAPAQNSFSGGELSPLLEGRQDLAKYAIGCRRLRNFLPMIQGPAQKRGGTRFVAEVKDSSTRTWLQEFIKTETDAVVVEFGNLYNRFYTARGTVDVVGAAAWSGATTYAANQYVTSGGIQYRSLAGTNLNHTPVSEPTWWVAQDAYEIASAYTSPYLINDEGSFGLSIAQSADVLYVAQATVGPQTLSRTSNTSWAYASYAPVDGPFDPQNIDITITVKVSAATGAVTFTNDAAQIPVAEGTAPRLIRIEETDKSDVKPWEANKRIAAVGENPVNELRRSDGHLYVCATNSTVGGGDVEYRTGSVKPIHTEGTEADGDGEALYSGSTLFAKIVGIDWTYLHSGYGVGRITSVAGGGATAQVTTLSRFPASMVSPGTSYRWSLGAWYGGHYPTSVSFYRDRLCWAGGQRLWLSVAADYTSMAPDEFGEVLPDSAIDVQVSIGQLDQISWMLAQPGALLLGTGGGELVFEEITHNQVLGPANAKFELKTKFGSRKIRPLTVGDNSLYVQKGGRVLREVQAYDPDQQTLVSVDLTSFSEHITRSGLTGLAYAQNPSSLVWCPRTDGKVACLTYERSEETIAWSLHDFGGIVEAVACIPSPDTSIDDLYMIVRRTIAGTTKRYIEVLLPPYTGPDDPWLSCYQDCSLTYDGAQAHTLTPGTGALTQGTTGVTFTAGSAAFSSGDVGREIHLRTYDADAETWSTAKAEITGYTSTTVVTCTILAAFPSLTLIASGGWRLTATTISGLAHLNGQTVRVTSDGADQADCVVETGSITLTRAASVVHVGLPVRAVVQTMNFEAGAGDGTAQGKIKKFSTVTFRLFETMGGQYGRDSVPANLRGLQYRRPSNLMNEAMPLFTGDISVPWPNGYETEGRVCFVHDEGTPCCLVAIYPQLHTEDNRTGSGTYRQ